MLAGPLTIQQGPKEDGTIQEEAPSCSVLEPSVDSRAVWLHHRVGAGELYMASLALRFAPPDRPLSFVEISWSTLIFV